MEAYLDNAATGGKKPESVIKAVENALRFMSVNPGRGGYELSITAAEAVFAARSRFCEFFGAEDENSVIFTPSCTAALNYVIKGYCAAGDGIICSSLEHNAVMRPLHTVRTAGCTVDTAEVIFGDYGATVRSFERLIKPNTKLIICTHASNVTGHIMPIEDIGALCRRRGIAFAVDAAQTAGVLPIDMARMNIDFLCLAPHKGLQGPMGVGVLIMRRPLPYTVIEGGTGTDSRSFAQPADFPERLESGTVNLPGIMGAAAGLEYVMSRGTEAILRHETALNERLREGLSKLPGVMIYSPPSGAVPITTFNIGSMGSEQIAAFLAARGVAVRAGLHCAPSAHRRIGTVDRGAVRAAVGAFTTPREIAVFLKETGNLCLKK